MQFKEVDQTLIKALKAQQKEDIMSHKMLHCWLLIVFFLFLISLIYLVYLGQDNKNYANLLLLSVTLFVAFVIIGYKELPLLSNAYRLRLSSYVNHLPTIEFHNDFTITIFEKGKTLQIHEIERLQYSDELLPSLIITGKFTSSSRTNIGKYRLPLLMNHQEILNDLLQLSIDTMTMKNFHNNLMKKIFLANEELRSKVFIHELLNSYFLIPVFLHTDDHVDKNDALLPLKHDINLAYEKKDAVLSLYTEYKEISEDTLQTYPRCYTISFIHILHIVTRSKSHVLNDQGERILINPHSDHIFLNNQQLLEIYTLYKRTNHEIGGY